MQRFGALCLVVAITLPAAALASPHPRFDGTAQMRSEAPIPIVRQRPSAKRSPEARTHTVDLDGDGTVSEEEALRYYDWIFKLLDRNGDGEIAEDEFIRALGAPGRQEAQNKRLATLFGRLDRDSDRRLVSREFMGACRAHFSISDADGDGTVSLSEFRESQPL